MGHIIPMVELGKRLLTHHSFHVTIFIVTTDSTTTTSQILQQTSNLTSLNIVHVPPIDVSHKLPPNPPLAVRIGLTMLDSLPFLRSSITSIHNLPPPSALIVDMFGLPALPMARDLSMLTYVYFATSAWFSAVTVYFSVSDKKIMEAHAQSREPLSIPGCEPVRFEDTLEPFSSPGGRYLEPAATKALRENGILGRFTKGEVYAVGPLVRSAEKKPEGGKKDAVLQWLDGQPDESVIYVSFGSGGTMSENQMREVALGLELSQQRRVCEKDGGVGGGGLDVGPAGRDPTTSCDGGFVTHCGWNSVLESVENGVPMVAWPLYAEQKMNAFMLSEELGVAVRTAEKEGGVVGREEVAEVVRRVMVDKEGVGMRKKVKELKLSGEKALGIFGSSHHSLSQMTKHCELHLQASH
ncbi:hypothetical protein ACSQ67_002741 [Phaseolus vulgaris]